VVKFQQNNKNAISWATERSEISFMTFALKMSANRHVIVLYVQSNCAAQSKLKTDLCLTQQQGQVGTSYCRRHEKTAHLVSNL
jgi:hypothetical protein